MSSLLGATLGACGSTTANDPDAGGADAGPQPVLRRPSESGTIQITGDDRYVIMVNPEAGSISVFDAEGESLVAELDVGGDASSVIIHPDDRTVFVASRADATLIKVTDFAGAATLSDPLEVGSEPTGLALSPTGARLYVAEWAEGRIAVVDTASMTISGVIDAPRNPRSVAVTNDGDEDDDDELIIVPEFFGDVSGVEGTDTSRTGRVRIYSAADLSPQTPILFAPVASGFTPHVAPTAPATMTSPNQLWSVAIAGGKIYVPSVSASPDGPLSFRTNVQPVVYVADPVAGTVDATATANLAQLVRDQLPDPATDPDAAPRFFLADIVDLAFIDSEIAYVVSRGADVVQRVTYGGGTPALGSSRNGQIDVNLVPSGSTLPCHNPTGIALAHGGSRAYLNCWGKRALGILDLSQQSLIKTIPAAAIGDAEVQEGLRFFFTGRGRWSDNGWSDCASCHPDGLTDNITWAFPAGPRQSTSLDGSFSHGSGTQKQRIFNWTAIFDEVHDFERNTRTVSFGKGAVTRVDTTAFPTGTCGNLAQEVTVAIDATNLGKPVKEDQDLATTCTRDFDKIEKWMKTIRPPRAQTFADFNAVARGAVLFGEPSALETGAKCVACHGGAGWTVSRRFYNPSSTTNAALLDEDLQPAPNWDPTWNNHIDQIEEEQTSPTVSGPLQVSCVLRNVGTFGPAEVELRVNDTPAQGSLGYNVPSLYGLAVGAPYLHHGGAGSLEELFDDPAWETHLLAGNPNWLADGNPSPDEVAQRKADLIAFLLALDADTAEQPLPAGFDGCPVGP